MSRRDQVLGHAEDNDGIDEYDNQLPGWWVALFLFTVVWGVGYAVDYHFVSQRSQAARYRAEMAAAAALWPQKSASDFTIDDRALAEGAQIYQANCLACHGADLTGGIGPNLTDAEWIHGGSFEEVVATITKGVPEKGMLTWGPILGPEKIAQVAAFVKSKGPGDAR